MDREQRHVGHVCNVTVSRWKRDLRLSELSSCHAGKRDLRGRLVLLFVVLLLSACRAAAPALRAAGTAAVAATPVSTPTPTPAPTLTPTSVVVPPTATPVPGPTVGIASSPTVTVAVHMPTVSKTGGLPAHYTCRVLHTYPHDPGAFTQGLAFQDGILYEGTGLYGESTVRKVALETGEVLQRYDLAQVYFGEGIAVVGDRLYQVTWRNHQGFVYRKDTFELLQTFSYPTEGWGLTYDGTRLIMSDGTATLHFLDPQTLSEMGQVQVRDRGTPVVWLNELEYIDGQVWANVWQTDRIVRVDPQTGQVVGWIDLAGILKPEDRTGEEDVLNGIAYDALSGRLFVTGKCWPKLFEIELVPAP